MLEKLLCKTNIIIHKVNILEEKIAKKKDDEVCSSIMSQSFPFNTFEDFKELELSLMDDEIYKSLVRAF